MASDVYLAVAHATISQKKKSYQKQKPQNVQTGQDATRLIELESATELVKQNALISALSIIILKEISVCNGQLSASASSFEAMQASVPASLHKKVKGFVTLVRADIQHLNRSEQVQFLILTADQGAVLLSLSKPVLSQSPEFAAKEQAVSVMLNRMAQAQELLSSQMETFLKVTSTAPKHVESPPFTLLPNPLKPKFVPYADFTTAKETQVKREVPSSMGETLENASNLSNVSISPRMENVVFFSQEVMLRAFSENAPSLASIKIGPPSSSLPFCYAEGTPGARFQLSPKKPFNSLLSPLLT